MKLERLTYETKEYADEFGILTRLIADVTQQINHFVAKQRIVTVNAVIQTEFSQTRAFIKTCS